MTGGVMAGGVAKRPVSSPVLPTGRFYLPDLLACLQPFAFYLRLNVELLVSMARITRATAATT
jgi:hypothetical protein